MADSKEAAAAAARVTTNGAEARVPTPFAITDHRPPAPDMAAEVLRGLRQPRKAIPPKYFYDAEGSRLFDAITRLPEYYLTRTEVAILQANSGAIARRVAANGCLVEYGSGSSAKVRLLLDACQPAAYVPVDISKEHLAQAAQAIANDHPALAVHATCADYTAPFLLPPAVAELPRIGFFPGSSIGNFDPAAAEAFLVAAARTLGSGSCLVIGVDAKKEQDVLHRAYNDAAGVTAAFNRNLLRHLNAALGADFNVDGFEHRAVYNAAAGRVEMYLDATRDQVVSINGERVRFTRGEALHTENSYKYAPDEFLAKAERAGFRCLDLWTDPRRYFMVLVLQVATAA